MASKSRAGSKRSKKTTPIDPTHISRPTSLATIVEEVVVATGVVRYYITSEGGQGREGGGGIFLTQDEGETNPQTAAVGGASHVLHYILQRARKPLT